MAARIHGQIAELQPSIIDGDGQRLLRTIESGVSA